MKKKDSAVSRVANRIRDDVVKLADGELLGSEEELVARYEVSRPTLRQAAALVVQEHLLGVRRGVGGGYFARAPQAKAVSRMAALYLKFHHARLGEILAAFMPIRVELASLAAANEDPVKRAGLAEFLEQEEAIETYGSFREFVLAERRFNLLLGSLGNNSALGLFMEILLDLSGMIDRSDDMYRAHPDRVEHLRRERNALAKAVLEGEEEFAVIIARRASRLSSQWHQDDLAQRGSGNSSSDLIRTLSAAS
ncbi:FadR/GntR family transcriptional regulator [Sphingopyxis sp.]|uniref:FadR/GntR family transcriptional regulator n=1 Tax=Sphingopyxis sp. TaxID=1908224 RepID=UPI003D6D6FE9